MKSHRFGCRHIAVDLKCIVCGTSLKAKVKFEVIAFNVGAVIMKLSKARVYVTATKKSAHYIWPYLCVAAVEFFFFIAHMGTN